MRKVYSLTGLAAIASLVVIASWPAPSVAQGYQSNTRDHRPCTGKFCRDKGKSQGGVLVDGKVTKVQVAPETRGGTVNDHRGGGKKSK